MNVFIVTCLASWYDDWSSKFIGVYTTLEKAKEVYKAHLEDNTRECTSTGSIYNKQFWCNPEILEVEIDGEIVNSHDYDVLQGVE